MGLWFIGLGFLDVVFRAQGNNNKTKQSSTSRNITGNSILRTVIRLTLTAIVPTIKVLLTGCTGIIRAIQGNYMGRTYWDVHIEFGFRILGFVLEGKLRGFEALFGGGAVVYGWACRFGV